MPYVLQKKIRYFLIYQAFSSIYIYLFFRSSIMIPNFFEKRFCKHTASESSILMKCSLSQNLVIARTHKLSERTTKPNQTSRYINASGDQALRPCLTLNGLSNYRNGYCIFSTIMLHLETEEYFKWSGNIITAVKVFHALQHSLSKKTTQSAILSLGQKIHIWTLLQFNGLTLSICTLVVFTFIRCQITLNKENFNYVHKLLWMDVMLCYVLNRRASHRC